MWQRFGNSLALLFVGQARVWAMNRLARLMAVTVGLTATAAGIGDGAAAEVAKAGQLVDDFGAANFQIWQGIGHEKKSPMPSVVHTHGFGPQKKKPAEWLLSCRHPRKLGDLTDTVDS